MCFIRKKKAKTKSFRSEVIFCFYQFYVCDRLIGGNGDFIHTIQGWVCKFLEFIYCKSELKFGGNYEQWYNYLSSDGTHVTKAVRDHV